MVGFQPRDFPVDALDAFVWAAFPLVFVPDELAQFAPVADRRLGDDFPHRITFHGGGEQGPAAATKVGAVESAAFFGLFLPFVALHAGE